MESELTEHPLRVLMVGIGPIGCRIASDIQQRGYGDIVGAVDIAEDKIGAGLGALCPGSGLSGVRVQADLYHAVRQTRPHVAVLATSSSLEAILPVATDLLQYGVHVISTCEELVYPWATRPDLAERLDGTARQYESVLLGTGVNPGFLMDVLPLVSTALCRRVERIHVERVQDAAIRRLPFQRKIGAGLSPEEFEERAGAGSIRHVGLTESIHLISAGAEMQLDRTEEHIEAVVAERACRSSEVQVEPGEVRGVQQLGIGWEGETPRVELLFRAALAEPEPRDRIRITGDPDLEVVIPGGVNGDVATSAVVTNVLPGMLRLSPGLRTMLDISIPVCRR